MADDPTPDPVDPEPDPTPEPTDEWTPPTRDEWDAVQKASADQAAALKKANAESAARRQELKKLQQANEDDDTKAKREAAETALAAMKPVAIRAEAKSAFLAAGANAEKVGKLVRLLDLSAIEIDGDTVTGLDDQVTELKDDFPELFAKPKEEKTEKKPLPKVNTTPGKAPADKDLTPGDRIMQSLGIKR